MDQAKLFEVNDELERVDNEAEILSEAIQARQEEVDFTKTSKS